MGKSRLVHEALDGAAGAGASGSSCGPSPTARRAPTGAARPAPRAARHRPRAAPRGHGRGAARPPWRASAPDLLPMAPLLADVAPGGGAGHAGGRPHRPAVPRRPGRRRRRRPARPAGARARSSVVVEEAHWADGASAAPPRAGSPSPRRAALGGRRRAARRARAASPRHPASASCSARCRPTSSSASSSPPPRPTPLRPHEVAAIVAARRGQPAVRRGGHPPRAGRRARSRSCPSRCRPRWAPRSTSSRRPRGASCATARCSAAASGARCSQRDPGARTASRSTAATLEPLVGFIEADGPDRLRFRNSLVRDAAYEGLAYRVRARVHRHRRRGARAAQHRPRRRLPHPGAALRPRRRRRRAPGDYAQRAGRLAEAVVRQRRRRRPPRDGPRGEPAGAGRHGRRAGPGCGRRWATCASSPACSPSRSRPTAPPPGSPATTRSRRPTCCPARRPRTPAHRGASPPRCGSSPGRAACSTARTCRRPGAPWCGWTTSPPWCGWSRSARGRPANGRSGRWRRAGAAGEHETQVRALMLVDMVEMQLGVPGLGARHREALEICVRARAALAGGEGALEPRDDGLLRRPLDRGRRSGTAPAARWRWRRAAPSCAAQTDVNLGELLINQGHLDEAEEVLVERRARAAGVGRRAVPRRGPACSWRACTSAAATCRGRATGGRGRAGLQRPGQPDERARGRPGAGGGRAARRAGRRSRWRIIDVRRARSPRRGRVLHAAACACSAARALLALGRLDEAAEHGGRRARSRPASRSCPTRRRCCCGCAAPSTGPGGWRRRPQTARPRSDELLAGLGAATRSPAPGAGRRSVSSPLHPRVTVDVDLVVDGDVVGVGAGRAVLGDGLARDQAGELRAIQVGLLVEARPAGGPGSRGTGRWCRRSRRGTSRER